ncbi:unnamed protein product [Macrosiphum euphorbiae]|uniref:Uncharacterized protein n=1 Tax=Macrosiphum euphorbiae TaxID=13131 RepID=A0AAV0XM53_9HEMI|nr:unnamed protein product [Macrosiphum euphorbiae]
MLAQYGTNLNSKHTKHVDTALNETCRVITGCLKPTPLKYIYPLSGIAPPRIRRYVATCMERYQKEPDILCECGEDQSDDHLLQYTLTPPRCTTDDLALVNEKAIAMAIHWLKQNI